MDLFAGPGRDRERETKEVVDGSPLIAMSLYPGFRRFMFVDLEEKCIKQLAHEAAKRGVDRLTNSIAGDCNLVIDDALKHVPLDGATFCFIDPAGADAHWATIAKIAEHKPKGQNRVELFILFPYDMAIVRFLARDESSEFMRRMGSKERVDAVMPDAKWMGVYKARNRGKITPREARRRFAYIYWMGLKQLGYKHALSPRLMTTPEGRPLYFLFFASDHEAGERIMSHVFRKERDETEPVAFQLAMEFPEEELSMLPIEDPWDFKEGNEPWYDEEPEPSSLGLLH